MVGCVIIGVIVTTRPRKQLRQQRRLKRLPRRHQRLPQAAALRLRLAAPLNRYVVLIRFEGLNNKGSSKRAALVLFGGKRQTDCLRRAWLVSMR